ncbi:hypothetical protein DFJ73DRAFT_833437, partial [Zopfochytrium polystomum]
MNIRPSPLPSAPLDTVSLHPSSPYHSHHRTSSNPSGSSSSSSSSASNSSSSSLLVLRQHSDDIPLHMQHQLHNPNYPLHHQLQQQQNPRAVPSAAAVAFAPVGGDGNRTFAAAYAGPAAPAAADTSLHWYLFGYVSDLVVSGGLVALSVSLDRFFKPFERPFDPTDPDISHPIGRNIVNNSMLAVIVALVPLVVVAIANAVWVTVRWLGTRGKAMQRYPGGAQAEMKSVVAVALRNWHHFFLGLLLAVGLTGLITNTIKNWAGRLRPDFLARCVPDATTGLCTGDPSRNQGRPPLLPQRPRVALLHELRLPRRVPRLVAGRLGAVQRHAAPAPLAAPDERPVHAHEVRRRRRHRRRRGRRRRHVPAWPRRCSAQTVVPVGRQGVENGGVRGAHFLVHIRCDFEVGGGELWGSFFVFPCPSHPSPL